MNNKEHIYPYLISSPWKIFALGKLQKTRCYSIKTLNPNIFEILKFADLKIQILFF